MKKFRLPLRWKSNNIKSLAVAVAFGLAGTILLINSHAATPVANLEAENGAVSSAASTVTDTTASGSHAVKFGSGSGGGSSDLCASYPALPSSKPDATNTGVPAGTTLTSSGGITASTAGLVINAKNVSGGIEVQANNVTIENSKITTTGYYGIHIADGVTGTKILHNEIYTTGGGYTGIAGSDTTICGNYVHGWENGMTVGGNIMVQANFIEKLQSNQSGPHYDGIELYGGNNNQFWGNNILMTDVNGNWLGETGAFNLAPYGGGSVASTVFTGNWVGGGSYTLNLDDSQGAVTNLSVTNNVFYGSAPKGHASYGPVREGNLATTWNGNTWSDTGQTVSP